MGSPTITLRITADSSGGDKAVRQLNEQITGLPKATAEASNQAVRSIGNLERLTVTAAVKMQQEFNTMAAVIGTVFVGAIGRAAKSVFDIVAGFESSAIALDSLVKKGEDGRKLFEDVKRFALSSPFNFDDLLQSTQQLLAVNTQAKDVIPTLRVLSSTVAALGGNNPRDKLREVTLALSQIRSAGKLTGDELRQLRNASIPALDILAESAGKSSGEIKKAIEAGRIESESAIAVLLDGLDKRFGAFGLRAQFTARTVVSNLSDAFKQFLDSTFQEFLPQIKSLVEQVTEGMREFTAFTKDNKTELLAWAEALKHVGEVLLFYKIASLITSIVQAIPTAAALTNPWLALAAAFGYVAFNAKTVSDKIREITGRIGDIKVDENTPFWKLFTVFLAQSNNIIVDADNNMKALAGTVRNMQGAFNTFSDPGGLLLFQQQADALKASSAPRLKFIDDNKEATRILGLEARALDVLEKAQRKDVAGMARAIVEHRQYVAELGKSAKANDLLRRAITLRLADEGEKELRRNATERLKQIDTERIAYDQFNSDRFLSDRQFYAETLQLQQDTDRQRLAFAERAIAEERARRLRALDGIDDSSVEGKVAVEQQRAAIEIDFQQKSLVSRKAAIARETQLQLDELETSKTIASLRLQVELDRNRLSINAYSDYIQQKLALDLAAGNLTAQQAADISQKIIDTRVNTEARAAAATGTIREAFEKQYSDRADAIRAAGQQRSAEASAEAEAAIALARDTAFYRSQSIIRDGVRKQFDSVRSSIGSLFDALLARSKSFGQVLADAIKLPLLAAFKEIVSSRLAAMLVKLFGGGNVQFGSSVAPSSGGLFGRIGALATPIGFSGPGGSSASGGSILQRLLGGGSGFGGFGGFSSSGVGLLGPGGTSGFAGPLGTSAGSNAVLGSFRQSLVGGSTASLGFLASLKGFAGIGGSVATGAGTATTFAAATTLQKLSAIGKSNAALAAGGLLAFDGLRRGGLLGLAETTGAGALIGYKFGGPLGAAIGAGVGALAGTIRLFIKGASEKIIQRAKSMYGVTLSEKYAKDPILGIIKSQFGGDIDTGLRSPAIRDLIELYGMSTGQSTSGVAPNRPIPRAFAQINGTTYLQPTVSNGISASDAIRVNTGITQPGSSVTVQLDADATEAVLSGRAAEGVAANPRVVAAAVNRAHQTNYARRQSTVNMLAPSML